MRRPRGLLLLFALLPGPAVGQTGPAPYRDARLPVSERVRDLLGRMTLPEKFWQLFMIPGDLDDAANDWSAGVFGLQISGRGTAREHTGRINAIQRFFVQRTRLGIPIIPFEEALHGLAQSGATVFPQAIALAASWDTAMVARVAAAAAAETKSRGIRQVLSPVVNLAGDARWGRVEETYGEDPYLASAMARAFVTSFERAGVITTPKHFVANVGDGGRDSYPVAFNERTLEELYFPPFRSAVQDAHARSIMTAYNSVGGEPATQHRGLLTEKLKGAWGFPGFVISDAAATGGAVVLHRTELSTAAAAKHALEAGLDVIFQSSYPQHRPYLDAFQRGMIADSVIDAAVSRVLRAKFELGLFEQPFADPDSAAAWNGHAEHRRLALEAARAGIVLLRNQRGTLPLSRSLTVAVIGTDAAEARLGGYSGPGIEKVSILDGVREKVGIARLRYAPGPGRQNPGYSVVPAERLGAGLNAEYYDNPTLDGEPRLTRTDPRVDFTWTFNSPGRGIPLDWYSVRWTGTLTAPPGGIRRIGVEGNDGYRLYVDGRLLIDNWKKQSAGVRLANLGVRGGTKHLLRLEYFETTGNARLKLVWDAGPLDNWRARIDGAVLATLRSDAAIIVAGIEEGEFRDRASLALPGHQEELILRVAATGRPVVVVLVAGSAVTMSGWLERVGGVLQVWYPGEMGGRAVADVLFGASNPAGRLPISFPVAEGQLPLVYNHRPTGRGDDYLDLTGKPLFPFGFGLSYTTFEYSGLTVEPSEIAADGTARVRFRVKNIGTRAGEEVAQLYLRDLLASTARPVQQLAGFARFFLAPGEERELSFPLGPERLRMLNAAMQWVVEPGVFRIMVGASSADIRLRGELLVR